jgi:hypothetical protein
MIRNIFRKAVDENSCWSKNKFTPMVKSKGDFSKEFLKEKLIQIRLKK